jgi:hypothetical protein
VIALPEYRPCAAEQGAKPVLLGALSFLLGLDALLDLANLVLAQSLSPGWTRIHDCSKI